ncbi:ATP-dependent helicase [Chromohalobacter israelensis]|uniref:DNA 3'-5' helicase n=1 Tax=Chromohalobacter israelensis (strain ATCC BAA-138 / DSM 3043 / CIP 106854 / NCIMB 13768 / 1H11) TaxID=290398 RepID=Q1QX44_CHRI1|nr:ATP-dependent helicase [Chromohalobacter salexigens]ABE58964.1 UvrD/REP helicase [Chromohalobacter salexigens DSM 3043]
MSEPPTPEQRAVVGHGQGHARVSAVAGAGKTTTLVQRVLHLLASGVPPQRILVLMFNRAAREDFTAKLQREATGQRLPDVRTFHSIGHRLTQTLTRWGYLSPRQLIAADWQRERLLRQAVQMSLEQADDSQRQAALEADRLETLAQFCELVKAEMRTPEELHERLDFGDDTQHFCEAYAHFETLIADHGVMTYADLLYRPLRCLEATPEARARVQGFLDHVIVDEYQDINEVQQRLLAILAGKRAQVMAVGDANQCIYEWRGARPDAMFERFGALFGTAHDYPLSYTFRHGHVLALAANHAIRANRRRPDQLCLAAPGTPTTRADVAVGNAALLEALREWQQAGRALSETCVMVRSWALSVSVQLQLLRAGVPFRLAREDRFVFRLPLVQALAGYLALARDGNRLHDPEQLNLLLSQPTVFVPRETLTALARQLAHTQQWPERHDPLLSALKPLQRRNLKRRWQLLCELPRLGHWPPAKLLEHVVEATEADKALKRAASRRAKAEDDVRLLDVLIEQAGELANDPDAFIELLSQPVEGRGDGVLVTTVHGAKGLEWPLVALWGVNEEDFPHYTRETPLDAERLEEERRLYYVAITRARERLLVLHDGGDHRPSRFIDETAWDDCHRAAAALGEAPFESLAVRAPEVVGPYLERCGVRLPVTRVEESATAATRHWEVGQWVRHGVFGEGEIVVLEGDPANPVIEVRFTQAGRRRLIAARAPLEPVAAQAS